LYKFKYKILLQTNFTNKKLKKKVAG